MSEILAVETLSKTFVKPIDMASRLANLFGGTTRETRVHALDGVTLSIRKGEVLGIVGESGCGKSTLGRVMAGIHEPTSGTLVWNGTAVSQMSASDRRAFQLRSQMIFQDPSSSLNPRKTIHAAISEAPIHHGIVSRQEVDDYVDDILCKVGFDPSLKSRFPHQFSGGQRQRIGIARALAVKPEFLVCDESIAALDVSIQAQVINLFMDLRKELDLTYAFISHDLSVVGHIADRVAVMYMGRVVELGSREQIFNNPQHPYTRALLAETPVLTSGKRRFNPLTGEVPSPLNPPAGCHFHPRCPIATKQCSGDRPALMERGDSNLTACHHIPSQTTQEIGLRQSGTPVLC